jgi:hypothetical protein
MKAQAKAKHFVRFVTKIRTPSGEIIYAKDYGLKAFPIRG